MSTQSIPRLTPEEYLEIESKNEFRSEYIGGRMYAMAGGSLDHGRLVKNTLRRIDQQLEGGACEALVHEMKVWSDEYEIFIYPDIVVMCGPKRFYKNRRDAVTDATLIVEVLSPSTKNYDRAEKFEYYRSLPSFAEYLLLSQQAIRAEHYSRQPDRSRLLRVFSDPGSVIELKSIGCQLELQSLYKGVEFAAETEA